MARLTAAVGRRERTRTEYWSEREGQVITVATANALDLAAGGDGGRQAVYGGRRTWHHHPAFYIGRRNVAHNMAQSDYRNPHRIGKGMSREQAVAAYRSHLLDPAQHRLMSGLDILDGRDLVCWCAPAACHGDVLLEFVRHMRTTTTADTIARVIVSEWPEQRISVDDLLAVMYLLDWWIALQRWDGHWQRRQPNAIGSGMPWVMSDEDGLVDSPNDRWLLASPVLEYRPETGLVSLSEMSRMATPLVASGITAHARALAQVVRHRAYIGSGGVAHLASITGPACTALQADGWLDLNAAAAEVDPQAQEATA
jgi:hypothetical protein